MGSILMQELGNVLQYLESQLLCFDGEELNGLISLVMGEEGIVRSAFGVSLSALRCLFSSYLLSCVVILQIHFQAIANTSSKIKQYL